MRGAVIGGALLVALLTWRLVPGELRGHCHVGLWTGEVAERDADATARSGGMVRAYAETAAQSLLAARSLSELRSSPTLRDWAGYRETGSVVVRPAGTDAADSDPAAALAVVED